MTVWAWVGLGVALATGLRAAYAAVRPPANFYAEGIYGMRPATHAWYAIIGFALAALFAISSVQHAIPAAVLLAVAVLVAIFYFTSYLRGFSDEE
ncbi:MAG TPA: hypothetical protein VGZ02_01470 [Candidatus Baltobacteraceae bacterium]|jgi:hypothetical protein|nr:hypothetical protein [Candidatus Baltobacteraceae bacterium]